jgi:hypothetical protein
MIEIKAPRRGVDRRQVRPMRRYGVSWQIVPTVLGEMMKDPDRGRARRVMEAMLGMKKLDIAGLRRAYGGA